MILQHIYSGNYVPNCIRIAELLLPRYMECTRGLAMRILSARLSVRPSIA